MQMKLKRPEEMQPFPERSAMANVSRILSLDLWFELQEQYEYILLVLEMMDTFGGTVHHIDLPLRKQEPYLGAIYYAR